MGIPNLTKTILDIIRKRPNQNFNYKQIASQLNITDASGRNQIIKKLSQLAAKQQIVEVDHGKFQFNGPQDYVTGTLDMTSKGDGYVVVEDLEDDIFIPSKHINKAFHGDQVEVYIYNTRRKSKNEGEITKVIERKKKEFVGVITISEKFAFVNIQDTKMYTDFFIPKSKINGAENNMMVVVELEDWPEKADSPFGRVIEVLGVPGEHETEIHAILAQYGLPHEFPKEVEEFANKIDTSIQESEIKKRRDMRDTLTFTIDPK